MDIPAKPLLILGTRGFALETADLVGEVPAFDLKGFVENLDPERCASLMEGHPVYWVDELASLSATHWGVCSLGTTKRSAFIATAASHGLRFASVIHPAARVSAKSSVAEGCIICPGVQIASHTRIGAHVRVNRGTLIGHDTQVDDVVTMGPGVNVASFCRIGTRTQIGMSAVVLERISIGCGAVIAAGSVVTRDVPDHVMVAGVPAVVVRRDIEEQ
jgi:sugar O-acyltransferase (sialic acid O-acetyltransferase NeuD family)